MTHSLRNLFYDLRPFGSVAAESVALIKLEALRAAAPEILARDTSYLLADIARNAEAGFSGDNKKAEESLVAARMIFTQGDIPSGQQSLEKILKGMISCETRQWDLLFFNCITTAHENGKLAPTPKVLESLVTIACHNYFLMKTPKLAINLLEKIFKAPETSPAAQETLLINLLPYTQKNPASIAYKNAQELLLKIAPNIAMKVHRVTDKKRREELKAFLDENPLTPNYSQSFSPSLMRVYARPRKPA